MSFMQRQKNFWNEVLWKPKKPLSLEQLKYHHLTLERNHTVTESNKKLLVETFRSIAEILIWGDQNDSSVFDFFLEKNMQSFFLKILGQQPGRYVVLQLLQTMSILFENIRNETSIYYLLSNNHVNSLIILKLDFSDEEVLAYYISFLKTLSFKLNKHTIHFFYNEHLRDFPLYTEAIKFFNNPESMVRIAVRTLSLNVYKVEDKNTIEYICNKTAAPYFSNLVWFIGNHVLQLDECLEQKSSHLKVNSLESAVAEHLDHLHYINDILSLNVTPLNDILRDHLLNRLFIPLYVYSLFETSSQSRREEESPKVSSKIALFLLSQVFLIISHPMLTTELAFLILTGDQDLSFPSSILKDVGSTTAKASPIHRRNSSRGSIRGFVAPEASLTTSLTRPLRGNASPRPVLKETGQETVADVNDGSGVRGGSSGGSHSSKDLNSIPEYDGFVVIESPSERELAEALARQEYEQSLTETEELETEDQQDKVQSTVEKTPVHSIPIKSNVFLEAVLSAVIPGPSDDSRCLFAIAMFYGIIHNNGVSNHLLEAFSLKNHKNQKVPYFVQTELVGRLLSVIEASAVGSVRLVTLHLCVTLLSDLLHLDFSYTADGSSSPSFDKSDKPPISLLSEHHSKKLERAMEEACRRMEKFYRTLGEGDEVFLEVFEDEYSNEKKFCLKVNYLLMDATMLLPATDTPLTGIDFIKRLPCGETEKARKAMRVFFAIRKFHQCMYQKEETLLPLTPLTTSVVTEDVVDTTNSDLVRCDVITGECSTERFLVVTENEFILVDPDKSQLGCGIVKFIAFLQDVDVSQDPADNISLRIVAYHRSRSQVKRRPALTAKITFEDNIRCLATRQNLQRKKDALRHKKMSIIAEMLGIPPPSSPVRKRENIPSVTVSIVSEPVDNPNTVVSTTTSPSPSSSPHKYAATILTTPTDSPGNIPSSNMFDLGLVDSNGIPVSVRAPSPHAYYVSNKDEVTLSLGVDPFESKVKILPPKKAISVAEYEHSNETDGFPSSNGNEEQQTVMLESSSEGLEESDLSPSYYMQNGEHVDSVDAADNIPISTQIENTTMPEESQSPATTRCGHVLQFETSIVEDVSEPLDTNNEQQRLSEEEVSSHDNDDDTESMLMNTAGDDKMNRTAEDHKSITTSTELETTYVDNNSNSNDDNNSNN